MVNYDETNLEVKMSTSVTEKDKVDHSLSLLNQAKDFIKSNYFDMAVVISCTACEVAMERVLFKAIADKDIVYLEKWLSKFLGGYNPTNERVQGFLTVLTGKELQKQPFWVEFKNSVEQRNQIVHRGISVGQAEAERSLSLCTELVNYLQKEDN